MAFCGLFSHMHMRHHGIIIAFTASYVEVVEWYSSIRVRMAAAI